MDQHVVILSAASRPQLDRYARRLCDHLRSDTALALPDIAFTLQTGRVALAHRLVGSCTGIDELCEALDAFVAGRAHPAVRTAVVETPVPHAGPVPETETAAADAWLAGRDVPWEVYRRPGARRVSLPTYPFRTGEVPSVPAPDADDYLIRVFAEVSGIPAADLDPHVPLENYGISSFLIAQLNAALERDLGETSRTLFYEHQDLAGVARALSRHRAAPAPPVVHNDSGDGAVAIIGIAGRYPMAPDLDRFWDNLMEGRDCVTQLPEGRRRPGWPVDLMWGGFLDTVDEFDPLLFGITPRDAARMDPQERIFLEVTWEALEDAGYPRTRLRERHGSRVAVYAGAMYNEYPYFGVEQTLRGFPNDSGSALGNLANRVSYHLDLHGPSVAVDTMCSSALTAVHLAVRALRAGECEVAIAGAANLSLHPNKFHQQARLRLTASDHRCRSFGDGGDGFVPAEGVGVVVLKPLRRALADGDRVHAVILGTAFAHAGKTNGYMVPSPVAQGDTIRQALADAGVPATRIGYIEAHGTGTALGDPVEMTGLLRAFGTADLPPGRIPLGSVKSAIGHAEAAAGLAGLTKVVLQLRHRKLAPSLHAEELNPGIDWDAVPFRVQREPADWPEPRCAGISSFGAGGTVTHIVVAEHEPAPVPPAPARPQLVVLSAYDEDRLRALAGRVAEHLRRNAIELADVAYTLQVGREPLRERLAVVAENTAEAAQALERFAAGQGGVLRGRAPAGPATSPRYQPDPASLTAVGESWVSGGTVDWPALYTAGRPPRLVGLPTYPFARMHCWLAEPTAEVPLYERSWTPAGPAAAGTSEPAGVILCVHDDATAPVAAALAAALGRVRCVHPDDATLSADVVGWIDLCDLTPASAAIWSRRLDTLRALIRTQPSIRVVHACRGLLNLPGPVPSLAGARMAGYVRVLGAEYPKVRATVVDTDLGLDRAEEIATQVRAEWLGTDPYGEVCYRNGRRHLPSLTPLDAPHQPLHLDPDGVYLVTGGTRGIGATVARHLVQNGARRLALLGLHPPATPLEDLGAAVAVHSGPLTDRAALSGFLDTVRSNLGRIAGVVHCAGRFSQGPLLHRDAAAVMEPKVDGTDVLFDLCAADRPAFFVLFSSMCAAVPRLATGVVDYAAANAYLDLFAGYQLRSGRSFVRCVNWPMWTQSGAGVGDPNPGALVGIGALDDADALRVFDRVVSAPTGTAVLPCPGDAVDVAALPRIDRAEVGSAPPSWLVELFAQRLGMPVASLDPTAGFGDLGVESVLLAELVQGIEERIGRPLPPGTLLDHPTLERLSVHLGQSPVAAPAVVIPPPSPRADDGRVAIVGIAGRFPGAEDIAQFWANLAAGRCSVREVPDSRWDHRELYRPEYEVGRSLSKWGGFVDGIEDFDPEYFGMSDDEGRYLDPAIRLFLESTAVCLADAGYPPAELAGRNVGVFVGGRLTRYGERGGLRPDAMQTDENFIAARVAHHFDLRGPNLVVDSACSSALVGVQLACRSLLAGDADLTIAGGVEVLLDEQPYLEFSAGRALSRIGRCRTFDERADGFVPGEGCAAVLLKPLAAALADGDRIHAVIEAAAVNNDGRTMGISTPNPDAQAAVIRRALALAGRTAEDIGMVEAHGTGTLIGDPIELRALTEVFRETSDRVGWCAIGSVKSNVGHLLRAAGIAGLVKAVLAVERGEIPATLFCQKPNPRFDFAGSPFFPNPEPRRWAADRPRVAGVSSFGLGGTNAHVIVAQPDGSVTPQRSPLPPPACHRRRLWLDRSAPEPEPAPAADDRLVSAILDLDFR